MKKTVIVAVMILGLASISMARPGGGKGNRDGGGHGQHGYMMQGKRGPGGPGGLMAMADKIELTDQQIEQIQKLSTDFRLQMVDQRASIKKATIMLRALKRDEIPESKIMAAIDDLAAKKAAIQKQRYQHHQQIRSILTEEQQEKAKKLRKGRRFDGYGPQGHRRGMHGGRFFDWDFDEDEG